MALIFSPRQRKREGERQRREREVTLLAEWQWPSCIASLKWREGEVEGG